MKKNKKLLVGAAAALIVAASGLTYAWFTSQGTEIEQNVTAGRIEMKNVAFIDDENGVRHYADENGVIDLEGALPSADHYWYEEGVYYEPIDPTDPAQLQYAPEIAQAVTNPADARNLPFVARISDVQGTIELYDADTDTYGTPEDLATYLAAHPGAIKLEPANTLGYYIDDEGELLYAWMYNPDDEDDKYLAVFPGGEVPVFVRVIFDGNNSGNELQLAKVNISSAPIATQQKDAATRALGWKEFTLLEFNQVALDESGNEITGLSTLTYEDFLAKYFPAHYEARYGR